MTSKSILQPLVVSHSKQFFSSLF